MNKLYTYTIYLNIPDQPDLFVARRYEITPERPVLDQSWMLADKNIENIQKEFQRIGLVKISGAEGESIIETWI